MPDTVAFWELSTAAYCPRQLYYERREEWGPPHDVERIRALAGDYPALRDADDAALADAPIAVDPGTYRARLDSLAERDVWDGLCDPEETDVLVEGRDCRGRVHKVLAGGPSDDDPPTPALVSAGRPPENGVWGPEQVRAVAAALALAWREGREVPRALVEYPAHGRVRSVPLTVRRKARYRRVLRTVRAIDGPPPRVADDAKCDACDHRERCGAKTRTLRSLLGL